MRYGMYAVGLAAFLLCGCTMDEMDSSLPMGMISMSQLPTPAQTTVRQHSQGAVVRTIEGKRMQGQAVYEVEMGTGQGIHEICVTPEGEVIRTQIHMRIQDLPTAVRHAVEKETKGGQILLVEKTISGQGPAYEVEFWRNGHRSALYLDEHGQILPMDRK